MNLAPVPNIATGQKQKLSPNLDDRQKRIALLMASGEFDTYCDRIQDGLNDLVALKDEYVTALVEKNRDNASVALMSMAGMVERVGDQAYALAQG